MRRSYIGDIAALAIAGLLVGGRSEAQASQTTLNAFLERGIGLTLAEMAALSRGEVVGKLLATADERDVAAFAAVQLDVPRSFFVERQLDLPRALRTPSRRTAELFANPAAEANAQALEISADELKDLRDCRPNACNFKLPATEMDAVRAIDASGPDGRARVAAFARKRMADFVTDYRRRGNAAMPVYDDLGSVRSNDAFAAMLGDSSYLSHVVPSLSRFLANYPHDTLPAVKEVIFWSVDELPHVRPVLRIMHEAVYTPPEIVGATVLAAKQIYANHYFEAGLEILSAVDRTDAASTQTTGITLIAIRRYRFDHLPSGGPLNLRGRVRGGLQDNVVADLTRMKREYEAAWHGARGR